MQVIRAEQALTAKGWQRDVCVQINAHGRIERVTSAADVDAPAASSSEVRVGALMPALANVHSHAFQRAMAGMTETRGPDPQDSFWTWRRLMYRFVDHLTPDDIEVIARLVYMEMLEAGFASVGEFHYLHHQADGTPYNQVAELAERIISAASGTGIGLTLLPVLYEQGGCDGRALAGGQRRFGNDLAGFLTLFSATQQAMHHADADAVLGVAPHSLRAVSPATLNAAVELSPQTPFHCHVAEQEAEVQEVEQHYGARPIQWLLDSHAVDERWCLIHCTQMLPQETAALARSGAVAGLCPITESSLGDGIFDGARYLAAGGRWGVGSDSNVRISGAEELRTLEYSQRLRDRARVLLTDATRSTGRTLYDNACSAGAQALGRQSGALIEGRWADLMAFDTRRREVLPGDGDALLDAWIFAGDDSVISDVWSAGRHKVSSGLHVNRQSIVDDYRRTVGRLVRQ